MNFYVYFHHPNQFLDIDTKTKASGTLGTRNYLDLSYAITENTLADQSLIPCRRDDDEIEYNFDDCTYEVIKHELLGQFGCVVPSLPPEKFLANTICINMNSTEIEDFMSHFSYLVKKRNCVIPCKTMEVTCLVHSLRYTETQYCLTNYFVSRFLWDY